MLSEQDRPLLKLNWKSAKIFLFSAHHSILLYIIFSNTLWRLLAREMGLRESVLLGLGMKTTKNSFHCEGYILLLKNKLKIFKIR